MDESVALQDMALSQAVYYNLPTGQNTSTPPGHSWTIEELIKGGYIDGISYNSNDTGSYIVTNSSLSSLTSMLNWSLVSFSSDPSSGFQGAAFQDPDSGQIVFAFRGTEVSDVGDLLADAHIVIPNSSTAGPNQFNDAHNFWDSVMANHSGANYSFTGHSLGGGIAEYMTYLTSQVGHSVTFNAVGIGQDLPGVNPSLYNNSITNYVNEDDLIGGYGVHLGSTIFKQDANPTAFLAVDTNLVAQYVAIKYAVEKGLISADQGVVLLNATEASLNAVTIAFISGLGFHPVHEMNNMLTWDSSTNQYVLMGDAAGSNLAFVNAVLGGGATLINTIEGIWNMGAEVVSDLNAVSHVVINVVNIITSPPEQAVALANQVAVILESAGEQLLNWIAGILTNPLSDTYFISGTAGNDGMYGLGNKNSFLYGLSGDDVMYGAGAWYRSDQLFGGAGNDELHGGQGKDVLDGGTGNDLLMGGEGDDTYTFGRGDGQDTIDDYSQPYSYYPPASGGTDDTLAFLNGISPSDIFVRRVNGSDLQFQVIGTTDSVIVHNYFTYGTIEHITFANGTVWDESAVREKARYIYGTDASEVVSGYSDQADILSAGAGDDIIDTSNGNDIIYAGAGNDTATGGNGDDTIYGGAGDDVLMGDSLSLYWGTTYGNGNDVLDGGTGNDLLYGGDGNDTYVFSLGDGQDTINDYSRTDFNYGPTSGGSSDVIAFEAGIDPSDIFVRRVGSYDLEFSVIGTTDKITVQNYFGNYGVGYGAIESVTFADGTTWDEATILDKARYIYGTSASEYIGGYSQDNIINAGAGDDTVYSGAGNDIVHAGEGNDTVNTGGGADVIDGGTGNDMLYGGDGNDTYIFAPGDGQDTIFDQTAPNYYWAPSQGSFDTIALQAGIHPDDVVIKRSGTYDLLISTSSTDSITVQNYFGGTDTNSTIEQITFADGTVWDESMIRDKARYMTGTSGSDYLYGYGGQVNIISAGDGDDTVYASNGGDTLYGGNGADTLHGGGGADTLSGGTGNDTLYGGDGNDTYLFARGDGQDTIYDYNQPYYSSPVNGGSDTIAFQTGISADDVIVQRMGVNLQFTIRDTTDSITVQNYFDAVGSGVIEHVTFADGTTWDEATIRDKARFITGTDGGDTLYGYTTDDVINAGDGDDVVYGSSGNDTIRGGAGNDTLYGDDFNSYWGMTYGSGNDVLDGGTGNDALYGGAGDDTYIFGHGGGQDTIFDYSKVNPYDNPVNGGFDTVTFLDGVTPADVSVQRQGADLQFSIVGTTDSITAKNFFDATGSGVIEQAVFADGTVWDEATLRDKARYINGTSGSDYLYGNNTDDVISAGDGNDTLIGNTGNDVLNGGAGDDVLIGDYRDSYWGSTYGNGNDILSGGQGNDTLYGGDGNDTYIFAPGDGQDTISDYSQPSPWSSPVNGGFDTIAFQTGIAPSDVTVSRVGNYDLRFSIAGTTDQITAQNYFDSTGSGVIEQVTFADGTTWDEAAIRDKARHINGTSGNDYISGYSTNDVITAGAGNDTISDYNGSNDTYIFGVGDGQDTITDYGGTNDQINFAQTEGQLIFSGDGTNLHVTVAGSNDSVAVNNWYSNANYQIESMTTGDGASIANTQIDQLIQAMASFSSQNNGISWSDALQERPQDVQTILSQYWVQPT